MVDTVRYINAENTFIQIEPESWTLQQPATGSVQDLVDAWIAEGNVIEPFNPYEGWSIEQSYESKEREIFMYAEDLIRNAYSNPINGVTVNPARYKVKVNRRKVNRADRIAGEIALSQTEKDQAKVEEKLSEYEVKITDDQDKAESNLHKLSIVTDIMAFDVLAESWNIWTPPV